ncbi:MAG: BREX-1 system adenine-specific DNA-methyltransferase PglX, partial [Candidatus Pacebacteria bacterium]|nr:BREX-1 system adenine-specific DNA-methyltransferase PglX [Candidatus Paceibacterota bacterium]
MEKTSAAKIVSQTFQNPFNKDSFIYFIKSLLNHIEPAPFIYRGNFIPDAYESYIKTLERIGKYQDRDDKKIDLLIVHLKKETSLERARTMQRNFIAWYLNGSRGDILKDAALVAFVSPNSDDWRFSLVKMDYRLDASGEKIKVKQELTSARRFSFLVGKTESSHTAQSRLAPILQDDDNDPTLKDLEDVFSVEKVTKEFFEKYRDLFLRVKEALDEVVKKDKKVQQDFKEKNIDTVNFAKKLLGQVVFLYFLQKKGWFGVERDKDWGTGPKNFLRLLFEKRITKYGNFFNDILEPLFYEALAIERTDDFYSRFNCKIPFLNGGLFDPINDYNWSKTDILLPNELFSNNKKTKEDDIGTGILDIFDRYNFTVKEDEPLEKEVAIDPEMLGKVFENLLAVKDRKSKGTYYTPREIVHYMCQQSLINYLTTELKDKVKKEDIETLIKYGETAVEHDAVHIEKISKNSKYKGRYDKSKLPKNIEKHAKIIDEKLASIRVCDPAVGSGAFPVGMMNEIIRTRNALTNYLKDKKKRTIYDFKRHAIQNCLYGVDIDPGAVEIAKLRLWLSLIVDEEDIKQIKSLPNLDYKIVCGNSLLGVEKNLFNQKLFTELEKLKPLFFNETDAKKKQKYKNQIDELINKITNGRKDFDFEVYFSEVFHEKKG